jgi:integrase
MLLFLTACRRGEIGDLQWSEVDLDNGELKIPPERTKTDFRIVQNPLSDLAVQILRRVERRPDMEHVFGRDRRNPASKAMGHLKLAIENHIKRTGGTPPQNWRLHDIRRTVRTQLAALGVSMDVAEAILGHVSHRGKVERTYNRYEYWPEKRQALARWEARLLAIVNGTAENIERPRFGKKIAVVGGEDAAAAQRSKDEECTDLPPLQAWMPSQQKKRETA